MFSLGIRYALFDRGFTDQYVIEVFEFGKWRLRGHARLKGIPLKLAVCYARDRIFV